MTRTFGLVGFHRPEAAVEAGALSEQQEGPAPAPALPVPALPWGWKLRRTPACVPGVAESSSSHFNEVLNNPEEFGDLRVAGCCFSAEFGLHDDHTNRLTAVAEQAVFLNFFFPPESPPDRRLSILSFDSGYISVVEAFFIQGESIIFSSFPEGKVSIMKSLSSPLRNLIPVCCGPPEAAI